MRESLLRLRQAVIKKYTLTEYIVVPLLRFIINFALIHMLESTVGYDGLFSNIFIMLGLSLIGVFLSYRGTLIMAIFLSTVFVLGADPVTGIALFILLVVTYMLFGTAFPEESIFIIVTLVALKYNVVMLLPIVCGIFAPYMSIAAMVIGILLYNFIPTIKGSIPEVIGNFKDTQNIMSSLAEFEIAKTLLKPEIVSMIIVTFMAFTTVYIVRRARTDYAPYIAIAAGGIINIFGYILSMIIFDSYDIKLIVSVIILTLLGVLIGCIIQFFSVVLDYQRAEKVKFEDEDNVYYVKIVPKVEVKAKQALEEKIYDVSSVKDINF